MKTLKCDLCEHEAQGETFEDWMKDEEQIDDVLLIGYAPNS